MSQKVPITVAHGDGIGPEIMAATLEIIQAAGAQLDIETIEVGEKVYLKGISAGIEPSAFDSIRRTKVFLKAPITTPQGGGFKSLNVTTRKTFGLYANVRPCVSYHPYIRTKHPVMDVVIVRENEEDLYAGVEYQQSPNVMQSIKLITRPGTERICRYAFEYAVRNNRKKVTCFTKDNIMKMSDGLFHKIFDEVGAEYPSIEKEHWIVDIGAAKLADTPEAFDVVVMPNLYGDILSDVAAQIAGSVGLAGSANIGTGAAMFEAIHGSAPRRAGQNLANPSGLFLGSIMMLVHIGQTEAAERAHNAWLKTVEDGIHTYDIFREGVSKQKVGTKEFAQAVVARLGQQPEKLPAASYNAAPKQTATHKEATLATAKKELVGVDLWIADEAANPQTMAGKLEPLAGGALKLTMMSNRGMKVWPNAASDIYVVDHLRCRFLSANGGTVTHKETAALIARAAEAGLDVIKTDSLYTFDGERGYSLAQGE
ncbi:MAG: NADP-dependent isocitrate dehydrogenase [Bryobacterales bacterium]|nr:NADP-dependent isocitrate dehydrogenase [Bryobacterales bacterium]